MVSKINLLLLLEPQEKYWPLDSRHVALMEFLGKPIIRHIIDDILRVSQVYKIVIILLGETPISEIRRIVNAQVDLIFERASNANEFIDIVSSYARPSFLLGKASDLGISMEASELKMDKKIIMGDNLLYVRKENIGLSEKILGKIQQIYNTPTYPWYFLGLLPRLLKTKIRKTTIGEEAEISSSAKILDPCYIGNNVKILENAVIKGPCYIGNDTLIGNNSLVRTSSIERESIIGANMEIARSWLNIHTETHSGYIGDTIFDNNVHTGAGFITGNVRLDRKTIKTKWHGKKIDTGLTKFGTIIGSYTEIGIHAGTMPGVLIGKKVVIGPGTLVFDNIPDSTVVYVKQEHVIKRKTE